MHRLKYLIYYAAVSSLLMVCIPAVAQQQQFGERLEERRISDFSDRNRNVYGRNVDLTLDYTHTATDTPSDAQAISTRTNSLGLSVSGGFSDRLGYSISHLNSTSKNTVRLRESGIQPLLASGEANKSQISTATFNYLLLAENASRPAFSIGLGVARNSSDSLRINSGLVNLRLNRNLESSSLFGGLTFNRILQSEFDQSVSVSGDFGVALVVNNKLSLSASLQMIKASSEPSDVSASFGLNYGLDRDWVLSSQVSTPLTGFSNQAVIGVSITSTFGGKLPE